MKRIQITHEDISDPERLRQRLDQVYAQNASLLGQIEALKSEVQAVRSVQGTGTLTAEDRILLKQLAGGGTSSAAPPQPGLVRQVETFADLPPTAIAQDGQMVRVRTTNLKYVFDGPTRTWVGW